MVKAQANAVVEEAEEGAPAWMVTFGDMMSLLLAFFVMLFSISEVKKDKFSAAVNSFQEYFDFQGGSQSSEYLETAKVQTFRDVFTEFLKGKGQNSGAVDIDSQTGDKDKVTKPRDRVQATVGGRLPFKEGSAALDLGASGRSKILDEIADKVRGYRFKISVNGHTSLGEMDRVTAPANQDLEDLSWRRAKMVKRYLVDQAGIRSARIRLVAYGASDGVAGNLTEADRARNRRVEIVALEEKVPFAGEK